MQICAATGKHRYHSQDVAERALLRLHKLHKFGAMQAYYCHHCAGYHVGHRTTQRACAACATRAWFVARR